MLPIDWSEYRAVPDAGEVHDFWRSVGVVEVEDFLLAVCYEKE